MRFPFFLDEGNSFRIKTIRWLHFAFNDRLKLLLINFIFPRGGNGQGFLGRRMVDAAIEEMHTNLSRFWTKTEDTLAGAGAAILMPFIQPLESFKPDGEGLESDDDDAEDVTGWMRTSLQCRPCGRRRCRPFLMPLVAHKKGPPAQLFQGPSPPPPPIS